MAPSIVALTPSSTAAWEQSPDVTHIAKKRKLDRSLQQKEAHAATLPQVQAHRVTQELEFLSSVPPHPQGIRPSGNAFDARINIKNHCGTFAVLPDELILQLLEYLESVDLVRLGGSCKALYAFTTSEDLWKTLFIESPPKTFSWRGSWRSTYMSPSRAQSCQISCADLYSDALYLSFHRAHVPLHTYAQNIPRRNHIARLPDMTPDDFNTTWASRPFILTGPVRSWTVFKDWSIPKLLSAHGQTLFRAEAVDWTFSDYVSYMGDTTDESPLYLFDCRFAEKMGLQVGSSSSAEAIIPTAQEPFAYTPPSCFSPDLFTTLGEHRPDHRWLIIGPARSGSTFHADPNGTSAWNAVIRGSKYWILFPPISEQLPGLHISPDSSHITAPLSIAEYLVNFHEEARRHPGCIEAICREGEVLHVPSGWFHLVLNLEDGIALTQNFVPEAHLIAVLTFLRDKREQVSGFRRGGDGDDLEDGEGVVEGREYELFVEKLRETYPNLLEVALAEMERRDTKKARKTKWEELTGKGQDNGVEAERAPVDSGFSFGFGFEGEDGLEEEEKEEKEQSNDE